MSDHYFFSLRKPDHTKLKSQDGERVIAALRDAGFHVVDGYVTSDFGIFLPSPADYGKPAAKRMLAVAKTVYAGRLICSVDPCAPYDGFTVYDDTPEGRVMEALDDLRHESEGLSVDEIEEIRDSLTDADKKVVRDFIAALEKIAAGVLQ